MRNNELMVAMLQRSLLEDMKLAEWVGRYPYGYRITAAGYDWLDERVASSE